MTLAWITSPGGRPFVSGIRFILTVKYLSKRRVVMSVSNNECNFNGWLSINLHLVHTDPDEYPDRFNGDRQPSAKFASGM